jgi:hypothetical protein
LGLLLSAAESAKANALQNEKQVLLYRDLLPKSP